MLTRQHTNYKCDELGDSITTTKLQQINVNNLIHIVNSTD